MIGMDLGDPKSFGLLCAGASGGSTFLGKHFSFLKSSGLLCVGASGGSFVGEKACILLLSCMPAGFSQKRNFSDKQAFCCCDACPQGLLFSQKKNFLKSKHCASVVHARRGFYSLKKELSEKQALCFCGTCPQGLFFS